MIDNVEGAKGFFLERLSEVKNHVGHGDLSAFILGRQYQNALHTLSDIDPRVFMNPSYASIEGVKLDNLLTSFNLNPRVIPSKVGEDAQVEHDVKLSISHVDADHLSRGENRTLTFSASGYLNDLEQATIAVFNKIMSDSKLIEAVEAYLQKFPLISG